jgi:hypothetical protein
MQEAALISAIQMQRTPPSNEIAPLLDFANLSMIRLLVKFERWDDILQKPESLLNNHGLFDEALIAYARAQSMIGKGRLQEAESQIQRFESKIAILQAPKLIDRLISSWTGKPPSPTGDQDSSDEDFIGDMIQIRKLELRGQLAFATGETDDAIKMLKDAAELQSEK